MHRDITFEQFKERLASEYQKDYSNTDLSRECSSIRNGKKENRLAQDLYLERLALVIVAFGIYERPLDIARIPLRYITLGDLYSYIIEDKPYPS